MYRKITVIAAVTLALVLAVMPVGAITFGLPDGDGHPNVGLTLTDLGGDALWPDARERSSPPTSS